MRPNNSSKAAVAGGETAGTGQMTVEKAVKPVLNDKQGEKKSLIYIGPAIAGIVRNSTAFKNGILPKELQKCVAEFPMMERLFVEIDKLPDAVRELKNKQSVLGVVYEQTARNFSGGK